MHISISLSDNYKVIDKQNMTIPYSSNLLVPTHKPFSFLSAIAAGIFLLLLARNVNSVETTNFDFTSFEGAQGLLTLEGSCQIANGMLVPIRSRSEGLNAGRALYNEEVRIWDSTTGNVASFATSFTVDITDNNSPYNTGFVLFLAPSDTMIPDETDGKNLGIVQRKSSTNKFVGIEFDNFLYRTSLDPGFPHIGIDVNSIISLNTVKWDWKLSTTLQVDITYDSLSKTLGVLVTNEKGQITTINQIIDLRAVLPEKIKIGFSASTTSAAHPHIRIYTWSFSSILKTSSSSSNITNDNIATFA